MIHIIWFHDVLWSSPVQKLQATHELCPASTASRTLALAPCEFSRLLGPPGASPKESPGGFVAAPTLRPGQKLGVWAAKIRAQCWAAKVGGLKTNKNHGIFQFPTNMSLIWDFGIYDWRKRCNNWNVINLNNETCAHQNSKLLKYFCFTSCFNTVALARKFHTCVGMDLETLMTPL